MISRLSSRRRLAEPAQPSLLLLPSDSTSPPDFLPCLAVLLPSLSISSVLPAPAQPFLLPSLSPSFLALSLRSSLLTAQPFLFLSLSPSAHSSRAPSYSRHSSQQLPYSVVAPHINKEAAMTTMLRELRLSLNQTQRVRLQSALQSLQEMSSLASTITVVADTIPVNHEDSILKGHGTSDLNGEVVATLCGVVERINKLVYVRAQRARYKPEVGDIIVGRVIEIAPKRWRLEINFSQDAVLMLSSMNLPDGIQRRRTAVDELNMRSIFEENDVICAEVRGFQHDGSLHLQARSQKYGKLERGMLLTVPAYLVKRRKQHLHHLQQYGIDLILGCNGFIWVGEHVNSHGENDSAANRENREDAVNKTGELQVIQEVQEPERTTPLEVRQHICRVANSVRLLSALGFNLTVEFIIDTVEASISSNTDIKDMLAAEFYVQTAEREVQRRVSLSRKH
ncbi:hypothetical protein ZIOFF_038245 [Zingiber officinale]|uniref:S1 motif domain-containing protein n=2 Tax=Zingiber officinale TaxID=94328 RepID=A0A8J5G138_ZINOF|nr:hypothetical protein ZIOFF_038245 [Zingiber officinale]